MNHIIKVTEPLVVRSEVFGDHIPALGLDENIQAVGMFVETKQVPLPGDGLPMPGDS